MDEVREVVKEIQESGAYKEWYESNPGAFLSCLILTLQSEKGWETAFYNKKTNRMTSFSASPVAIIEKNAEVFKQEETEVEELEIDRLFVTFEDAQAIVDKMLGELIAGEHVTKEIVILQKIKHNMWNVICITDKITLINIKIDAVTGKILQKDVRSAFELIDKEEVTHKKR